MITESLMPFKYDLIMNVIDIDDAMNFRALVSFQIKMSQLNAQITRLKTTILNATRTIPTC